MAKIAEFIKQSGKFLKAAEMKDGSEAKIIGEAVTIFNDTYGTERLHIPVEIEGNEYTFDASKTNARTVTSVLGDETKNWVGKILVLEKYKTKTSEGKMVDAINIKAVKA